MIELLLEAERALGKGRIDQAEYLYRQASIADPRNSIAVVGLGRIALERDDEVEAWRQARRALEIDSENVAAKRMVEMLEDVWRRTGRTMPDTTPSGATDVTAAFEAPGETGPDPESSRSLIAEPAQPLEPGAEADLEAGVAPEPEAEPDDEPVSAVAAEADRGPEPAEVTAAAEVTPVAEVTSEPVMPTHETRHAWATAVFQLMRPSAAQEPAAPLESSADQIDAPELASTPEPVPVSYAAGHIVPEPAPQAVEAERAAPSDEPRRPAAVESPEVAFVPEPAVGLAASVDNAPERASESTQEPWPAREPERGAAIESDDLVSGPWAPTAEPRDDVSLPEPEWASAADDAAESSSAPSPEPEDADVDHDAALDAQVVAAAHAWEAAVAGVAEPEEAIEELADGVPTVDTWTAIDLDDRPLELNQPVRQAEGDDRIDTVDELPSPATQPASMPNSTPETQPALTAEAWAASIEEIVDPWASSPATTVRQDAPTAAEAEAEPAARAEPQASNEPHAESDPHATTAPQDTTELQAATAPAPEQPQTPTPDREAPAWFRPSPAPSTAASSLVSQSLAGFPRESQTVETPAPSDPAAREQAPAIPDGSDTDQGAPADDDPEASAEPGQDAANPGALPGFDRVRHLFGRKRE